MWVYTNSQTWELIGTNTPTLEWLCGFTLIHLRGNSIGTDRTRPDRTGPDRHTLNLFNRSIEKCATPKR